MPLNVQPRHTNCTSKRKKYKRKKSCRIIEGAKRKRERGKERLSANGKELIKTWKLEIETERKTIWTWKGETERKTIRTWKGETERKTIRT